MKNLHDTFCTRPGTDIRFCKFAKIVKARMQTIEKKTADSEDKTASNKGEVEAYECFSKNRAHNTTDSHS